MLLLKDLIDNPVLLDALRAKQAPRCGCGRDCNPECYEELGKLVEQTPIRSR